MIWHSVLLMTVFDVLILAAVVYALLVFRRHARRLDHSAANRGLRTMMAGLCLIAFVYLADLLVMHVGPFVLPREQAMALMRELFLNYQWLFVLFGVGFLAIGFGKASRHVFGLLEHVKTQDQTLSEELSAREKVERALTDNEERFRDFAEASSDWYWEQDADLRFTMVSPGVYEKAGLASEGHIGKTRREVSGPGASAEAWAAHEAQLAAQRPFRDFVVQRSDPAGAETILSISGKPVFDKDGRFKGYRGIGRDITEQERAAATLRASEGRFQAFLDGSPDAVSLKDQEGRYLLCNKEFERFVGLSRDNIIGKSAEEIFSHLPELVAELLADERKVIETGQVVQRERKATAPDGNPRTYIATKFPVFGSDGRVTNVGTVNSDITVRRAAEEQLRQAQKMEALGQLTSGIAHDFNNLLAVILGNAELLLDRTEAQNEPAEAVIRAASRSSELTKRLLAFSRKQSLQPKTLDLNTLVAGMSGMLRRSLGERVVIEIVGKEGLWPCSADPGLLESALLNLAINARDAMPGGGKLTVETDNVNLDEEYAAAQPELTAGDYIMLAVSDSGVGMTPEVLERAFEPFFTTKEVGEGSGLGLSMVYGFAKQSGGHLSIYSELDHGTSVKLYLPRAPKREAEVVVQPALCVPRARGEVILVVEDDPDLLVLTASQLQSLGYHTLTAEDGRACAKVLEDAEHVDLLLTDVVLPLGISGVQLARAARQRYADLKVLFMSGYAENAIAHDGRLEEGDLLLAKPFRKAELARMVRVAIDGPDSP